MTEMELRVAKALASVHPTINVTVPMMDEIWPTIPKDLRKFFLQMARAAIWAMREPTDEMVKAAMNAIGYAQWTIPSEMPGDMRSWISIANDAALSK